MIGNKDDQPIVMWNISNTPLNDIAYSYSKPNLFTFYSKIRANHYLDAVEPQTDAFISNWRDEKAKMFVALDGLKAAGGLHKLNTTGRLTEGTDSSYQRNSLS